MRHRRPVEDADSGSLSPAPLKCQGLVDEEGDVPAAAGGAAKAQPVQEPVLDGGGSGHIGAFYPGMDDEDTKASNCQPSSAH
jgi:hypothetical protein